MELIKFEYNKGTTYCPKCGEDADCPECYARMDYCPHCGETLDRHDCFIVSTTEKYHGHDRMSNHTATLIIDGGSYACAHVEEDKSDASGDVAHLQLGYFPKEMQTETIANIISAFAKWVRFDWRNPDKISEFPTLVRLLGITTYKDVLSWRYEKWIALQNAIDIKVEHLAFEFTSKEVE